MSDAPREEPPDVQIDRLVLDIPGFDADAGARSSRSAIARAAGRVGLSGEHATDRDHPRTESAAAQAGSRCPDRRGVDGKAGLMSGFYLKGGLIEFTRLSAADPERHHLPVQPGDHDAWLDAGHHQSRHARPRQQPARDHRPAAGDFLLYLAMDSNDTIADGNAVIAGIAEVSGVYTRLAALGDACCSPPRRLAAA